MGIVDIISDPNGGAGVSGSGDAGAKLNENLKTFGKFFKRDLGGFGGIGSRFGSKTVSPAPPDDRK